jgi:hypothetical protein
MRNREIDIEMYWKKGKTAFESENDLYSVKLEMSKVHYILRQYVCAFNIKSIYFGSSMKKRNKSNESLINLLLACIDVYKHMCLYIIDTLVCSCTFQLI